VGPLDWLTEIDEHLDREVGVLYHAQPLAQDWARVSKVIEEVGEAIAELILYTQQNPRKAIRGGNSSRAQVLSELADVVITGSLAMQHFTKDAGITGAILRQKLEMTYLRIAEFDRAKLATIAPNEV
jgi:hypothetical protein